MHRTIADWRADQLCVKPIDSDYCVIKPPETSNVPLARLR